MNHRMTSSPRKEIDPFDGILLVDKPSGPTSHDIVAAVRRRFHIRKVGHGGTLDPMATGLLILLTGKGTRLSESVMGFDKTYEGVLHLGISTATEDIDGAVTATADASGITREQLAAEMLARTGDLLQTPPMVSAIKKDGVPLYKLARKGLEIERAARRIHIYEFELLDFTPPKASFRLRCTKGTYVRTLCADIGKALGCGAHLAELRRTRIGALCVDKALAFARIEAMTPGELQEHIVPIHRVRIGDLDQ